jgi:hypothetical protein
MVLMVSSPIRVGLKFIIRRGERSSSTATSTDLHNPSALGCDR